MSSYSSSSSSSSADLAALLAKTFALSVHTILHCRRIYPQSIFAPVEHNSLRLHESRHSGINKYVSSSCQMAASGMVDGSVASLVLTVVDEENMTSGIADGNATGTNGVIERYVFSYDAPTLAVGCIASSVAGSDFLLQYAAAEKSLFLKLQRSLTPPKVPFSQSTSFVITLLTASAKPAIDGSLALKQALSSNEWMQREVADVASGRVVMKTTPIKTVDAGLVRFNVVREL